jgi:hypothetical protein
MRKAFIVLGGLVLLLSTTVGLSQIDSGGGKGKGKKGFKGGPPGSSSQSPSGPGGGPSFGGPGGGGPSFGGPGGGSRDPNQFFDFLARGKDVLIRSELDPRTQGMFDRIAASMGITDGRITRQQYLQYQANRSSSGGPPGFSSRSGPGSGFRPSSGGGDGWSPEAIFRRLDLNGDGVLNYDELPEELRAERSTWDRDGNGFIDLAEFSEYYRARLAFQQQDRGGSGNPWGGLPALPPEDQKPVVYRAGKLPPNLPPWFKQYDTDGDAQIGLYEWKNSGRPFDEFYAMDQNGDGFVTVPEAMRYLGLPLRTPEADSERAPIQLVASQPSPGGPGGPGAMMSGQSGNRPGPPRGPGSGGPGSGGPGMGRGSGPGGGSPANSGRGGPGPGSGRSGPGSPGGPGGRSFQPPGRGGR